MCIRPANAVACPMEWAHLKKSAPWSCRSRPKRLACWRVQNGKIGSSLSRDEHKARMSRRQDGFCPGGDVRCFCGCGLLEGTTDQRARRCVPPRPGAFLYRRRGNGAAADSSGRLALCAGRKHAEFGGRDRKSVV